MKENYKVHALPTDKATQLRLDDGEWVLGTNKLCQNTINYQYNHLYITSDEKPKFGDKVIADGGVWEFRPQPIPLPYWGNPDTCRKIVVTTNKDLWGDGIKITQPYGTVSFRNYDVAKIPEDFIQAFVREQGIWEVELEMEEICNNCGGINCIHAICRSQIAKCKGITYRPKLRSNGTVIIHPVKREIDWEQVFDDAQSMHLQEFINYYKNQQ
jgi:hypothetical protein